MRNILFVSCTVKSTLVLGKNILEDFLMNRNSFHQTRCLFAFLFFSGHNSVNKPVIEYLKALKISTMYLTKGPMFLLYYSFCIKYILESIDVAGFTWKASGKSSFFFKSGKMAWTIYRNVIAINVKLEIGKLMDS